MLVSQFGLDFLNNGNNLEIPPVELEPMLDDEVAIIFWSSGTTGTPKGRQ